VSILARVLGGVIAAIVLSLVGSDHATTLIPTPIGVGAKYRLSAAPPAVLRGVPVRSMRCRDARHWASAHVEVFAARRVVILPAGIGMAKPVQRNGAYVTGARCSYPVRTVAPTGVVQFAPGTRATVGDLFAVWGARLTNHALAGFRGRVSAYVSGRAWRGDVRAIRLRRHAQIVLEIGGYVPPHPFFLFGAGQ